VSRVTSERVSVSITGKYLGAFERSFCAWEVEVPPPAGEPNRVLPEEVLALRRAAVTGRHFARAAVLPQQAAHLAAALAAGSPNWLPGSRPHHAGGTIPPAACLR
jgi:hypothetical protein